MQLYLLRSFFPWLVFLFNTANLCFFILAGHKEATAYASNILEARLNTSDPNSFGVRYQYLVAWGAEVIYPDALAMGYWTFDPIN